MDAPYPLGPMPLPLVQERLNVLIESLSPPFNRICREVLSQGFLTWPGSASKHHAWRGGLGQHTLEVGETAALLAARAVGINRDIVVAASLWHDSGKLKDIAVSDDGVFTHTPHHKSIYHISLSYLNWVRASDGLLHPDLIDQVSHCILAHHGRKDYGSPVEPLSREARIVHYADMMSAWAYQAHPEPQGK
jgi:3'-5' exoribonuclease